MKHGESTRVKYFLNPLDILVTLSYSIRVERKDKKFLDLSNQNITGLPESIGNLVNLKELYLENNQL